MCMWSNGGKQALSGLTSSGRRGGDAVMFALVTYVAVCLLWQIGRWGGPGRQTLIGDLALLPPNFVAAWLALSAAAQPTLVMRARRSWRLFALASLIYGLGDGIWAVRALVLRQSPYPGWTDVARGAFAPMFLAGLLLLPVQRRQAGAQRTFWLDVGTALVGGAMLVWYLVLRPLAPNGHSDLFGPALALLYPMFAVALLLAIVAVLLRRPDGISRPALYLLITGVACEVIADLLFSYFSIRNSVASGSWADAPWMLARLCLALGAWWQYRAPLTVAATTAPGVARRWLFRLLPYTSVALGYLLLLGVAHALWLTPIGLLMFGAGLLTALVIARQVIVLRENARLLDEVSHQALHDALTGLPNRRLFGDRVAHALARAARLAQPIFVLFLDLDGFKTVNDSIGHAAGDQLLVAISQRLLECVRFGDTVARLGGDEFAVMLEGQPVLGEAVEIAERALAALRAPVRLLGREVQIGTSIGIAGSMPGDEDAVTLLRNADLAMYAAKAQGKGTYIVYQPEAHGRGAERLDREVALRRAIARREFVVQYQPIVALASGHIVGAEALVRWRQADGRLLAPDEFIPLAEETGLIVPLGRLMLQEACRQGRRWLLAGQDAGDFLLGVNVSARQLQRRDFAAEVAEALREAGLPAGVLVLELTERALLQDATLAGAVLRDLKALGVRLALDDFGTGYSSLTHLQRFPLGLIKIDHGFVGAIDESPEAQALARGVIDLGKALHLPVIAEGIERSTQLAQLCALGCEFGQGFLFSDPCDAAELGALLERELLAPAWTQEKAAGW